MPRYVSNEFHPSESFAEALLNVCGSFGLSQAGAKHETQFYDIPFPLCFSTAIFQTSESLSNRLIGMSAAVYKITASLSPNVVGIQFREWMCDAVIDVFRAISALARAAKEGTPK